jgi:hypothetical protein
MQQQTLTFTDSAISVLQSAMCTQTLCHVVAKIHAQVIAASVVLATQVAARLSVAVEDLQVTHVYRPLCL